MSRCVFSSSARAVSTNVRLGLLVDARIGLHSLTVVSIVPGSAQETSADFSHGAVRSDLVKDRGGIQPSEEGKKHVNRFWVSARRQDGDREHCASAC